MSQQQNHETPVTPTLCANNCGFYGNPANNFLCSKCFREFTQQSRAGTSAANNDTSSNVVVNSADNLTTGSGSSLNSNVSSKPDSISEVFEESLDVSGDSEVLNVLPNSPNASEVPSNVDFSSDGKDAAGIAHFLSSVANDSGSGIGTPEMQVAENCSFQTGQGSCNALNEGIQCNSDTSAASQTMTAIVPHVGSCENGLDTEKSSNMNPYETCSKKLSETTNASLSAGIAEDAESIRPVQTNKNRCWKCNKKLGLIPFSCRCGYIFCGTHRYADSHECDFNYKAFEREQLSRQNAPVVAEKLERI